MNEKLDPHEMEGLKRRVVKKPSLLTFAFALLAFLLGVIVLTPVPEKVRRRLGLAKPVKAPEPKVIYKTETVIETEVVEKEVRVIPKYYTVKKGTDVAKSSMGFDFRSEVVERPGRLTTEERATPGSFEANYTLSVNKPVASSSFEEVVAMNEHLPKILPGLEKMMAAPVVSPFFDKLYENKFERLKSRISRMDRILTKHNYYDCQTMLELVHPGSNQKVFLLQGDMDVVSDGSDGDRLPTMPDEIVNSPYYQPSTSYGWDKLGTTQNPLIPGWKRRLAKARSEGNADEVRDLEAGIEDMQKRSFLIADYDPFVVMPVYLVQDRESPFGPNIGDYVAVIYGDQIYPAIVGDAGPSFKVGEGSLRMAKQINEKSSAYRRPVSDVSVTYVVFPRSSGKWQPPNYAAWRQEVSTLLESIGGLGEGYTLHTWENTLPSSGQ